MKPKLIETEAKFGVSMKAILELLYSQNYYSYQNIADFLEVDCKSVRDWAKEAGIKSRSRSEAEAGKLRKKSSPELLLQELTGHLSLCVCPRCQIQEKCFRGQEWHKKGYCVMVCANQKLKIGGL